MLTPAETAVTSDWRNEAHARPGLPLMCQAATRNMIADDDDGVAVVGVVALGDAGPGTELKPDALRVSNPQKPRPPFGNLTDDQQQRDRAGGHQGDEREVQAAQAQRREAR